MQRTRRQDARAVPEKRGSVRSAKLAVVPCLSLFDLPEDRERRREKKEEEEKGKHLYTQVPNS